MGIPRTVAGACALAVGLACPSASRTQGDGTFSSSLKLDVLLDITAAASGARSISVVLNRGAQGLAGAVDYPIGFPPLGHRIADMDLDGAADLIAFASDRVMVIPGRKARPTASTVRRGDVDSSGRMNVHDAILVLSRLFLGGAPLPCEDAADAGDDGRLNVTDPILLLGRLFLGGAPLPPPGPDSCGEDPTGDALTCAVDC